MKFGTKNQILLTIIILSIALFFTNLSNSWALLPNWIPPVRSFEKWFTGIQHIEPKFVNGNLSLSGSGINITLSNGTKTPSITFSTGHTIVTTNYTSGSSVTISGVKTGDVLDIVGKGDLTGLITAVTIQLNVAGSVKDQVVSSLGMGNQVPFSLAYQYTVPSTSNVPISITSTGGTLADLKIKIIQIR